MNTYKAGIKAKLFSRVTAILQEADEHGGLSTEDYIDLMEAVANEARSRRDAANTLLDEVTASLSRMSRGAA